eukprot:s3710_g9.t1
MTAVRKPDGGVRGIIIATGDVFRRLVSRALAKTWVSTFDAATRPFQHALSARSGMDALVAPALLPFVRLFYGQPSVYCWWDDTGTCRDIHQAEGCEQGDALAPALFSLGQHEGLEQAAADLRAGEELLAYLDDLYVITRSVRPVLDVVTNRVQEHCGIASNVGKTRVYNTPAEAGRSPTRGRHAWRQRVAR